jgi:hypothetical protein
MPFASWTAVVLAVLGIGYSVFTQPPRVSL